MANNAYPSYDVRSRDDPRNRALQERDPDQRYDLPRPFRPRPIPEGQVERRFMGPVDTPATIATRHAAVLQAVENYKTRCPDVAKRAAEAGAAFRRRWEESRAAEMETAGAAGGGGEEAGSAQPEAPGDAPEAEPEAARPPIYVDDIAANVNVVGSWRPRDGPTQAVRCDCAECDSDPEAPPPYPRRRAARGAVAGTRRADSAARPRPDWRLYRD